MRAPLVCAVLGLAILRLAATAGQCVECAPANGSAVTAEPESGRDQAASWPQAADFGEMAAALAGWLRNAWDSRATIGLRVLRNEQNDTLVNVRFGDPDPADGNEVGRTFGIRRRMQMFLLLPISFKLGIIMTLLLVLTAMSLKTLIIGFVILLLLLHQTHGHAKLWGPSRYREVSESHKNIHIHLHTLPEDHRPYVQSWHEAASHQPYVYSA